MANYIVTVQRGDEVKQVTMSETKYSSLVSFTKGSTPQIKIQGKNWRIIDVKATNSGKILNLKKNPKQRTRDSILEEIRILKQLEKNETKKQFYAQAQYTRDAIKRLEKRLRKNNPAELHKQGEWTPAHAIRIRKGRLEIMR